MIFISFLVKGLKCGSLTSPQHGNMTQNGTLYGDSIHFGCNAGYVLHGNNTGKCLATGNWSTKVPTCQRKC